ncbi:uncharacterized protein LOC135371457 [Ornithodoros turicata]|uniref:uncharacterized protein LOC135371457 n=1 Tax=Ornithodoros turicata TaxID=34597 RepID=UPI0031395156
MGSMGNCGSLIWTRKAERSRIKFPKSEALFKQWISKIKRHEGPLFEVTRHTKVCSKHFRDDDFVPNAASGKHILRDHAVPSMFSFASPKQKPRRPLIRRSFLVEKQVSTITAESQEGQENTVPPDRVTEEVMSPQDKLDTALTERACAKDDLARKETVITKLTEELQELKCQVQLKISGNYRLSHELEICKDKYRRLQEERMPFCIEKFRGSNEDFQFNTGLPNYATFCALLEYLAPVENPENIVPWNCEKSRDTGASETRGRPQKLSTEKHFLVLVKLRLGLFHQHLAHLFCVSKSYVSKTFTTWINFVYVQLGPLLLWQSRETVDCTTPDAFKDSYPTTRVIIDATEVKCEAQSLFVMQSRTYSNYKYD